MNSTRRLSVLGTSTASQRLSKPETEPAVKKFIKIILLPTIKEKLMKIPERFVRCGPKLSDTVTIETPAGFKCCIMIKRIGDEVWLEKGWSEFVEAHSLREGHLLYFHYIGNSSFLVVIFDVTASEIEYPMDKSCVIESGDEVMEVVDDDAQAMEVVDDDEVIDLDELLMKKEKPIVNNIKCEKVTTITPSFKALSLSSKKKPSFSTNSEIVSTIIDLEEIDSMDEAEEDERLLRRINRRF